MHFIWREPVSPEKFWLTAQVACLEHCLVSLCPLFCSPYPTKVQCLYFSAHACLQIHLCAVPITPDQTWSTLSLPGFAFLTWAQLCSQSHWAAAQPWVFPIHFLLSARYCPDFLYLPNHLSPWGSLDSANVLAQRYRGWIIAKLPVLEAELRCPHLFGLCGFCFCGIFDRSLGPREAHNLQCHFISNKSCLPHAYQQKFSDSFVRCDCIPGNCRI